MAYVPAVWVLARPSVVSLNENEILAAAERIPRRQLRSGFVRPVDSPPPRPPPRRPLSHVVRSPEEIERESQQAQVEDDRLAMDQQPTDSLQAFSDDGSDWDQFDDWGEFGDWAADDFAGLLVRDDESFFNPQSPPPSTPSPPPPRSPSPRPSPPLSPLPPSPPMSPIVSQPPLPPLQPHHATVTSQVDLTRAFRADQPRRPWNWSTTGYKTAEPYEPQEVGKWWYDWARENPGNPALSHVGRIMETELGEKVPDDEKCTTCRASGQDCWIYSEKGRQQVRHPGSACGPCRAKGTLAGKCSVSKRRKSRRRGPASPPPRRDLAPRPPRGPDPGAGGMGIAV